MIQLIDCYTELIVYAGAVGAKDNAATGVEEVQAMIDTLIQRSREAAGQNGFDENIWLEGFFPVAAWIDEFLLCSSWAGKGGWARRQLQRKYFNINNAGEAFFQRLADPAGMTEGVLSVYELMLAIGFRGCHYHPDDEGVVEELREGVASLLPGKGGAELPKILFAEAYPDSGRASSARRRRFIPSINHVSAVIAVAPVLLFIVLSVILGAHLEQLLALSF